MVPLYAPMQSPAELIYFQGGTWHGGQLPGGQQPRDRVLPRPLRGRQRKLGVQRLRCGHLPVWLRRDGVRQLYGRLVL